MKIDSLWSNCLQIASEIAVAKIVSFFQNVEEDSITNEELFLGALEDADLAIASESVRMGMKMGCAIAIVLIDKEHLYCVSLGNIRVQVGGETITEDDVYVDSVGGTYLTNCLRGRGIKASLPIKEHVLTAGWTVRICSDGFYNDDSSDDASVIDIME